MYKGSELPSSRELEVYSDILLLYKQLFLDVEA